MAQKAPPRKRPSSSSAPGRRKSCHFCKDKVTEVDYKNVNQLRRYISEKGKIRNRRITGLASLTPCWSNQLSRGTDRSG